MRNVIALAALATLFVGCASYKPYQATNNSLGSKRGKACSSYILGFHTGGHNHIYSAAKGAGISKIASVDAKKSGLFPLFWKDCTYVSGN